MARGPVDKMRRTPGRLGWQNHTTLVTPLMMIQSPAEIEPMALQRLLVEGPKPVLVDVREPWEFAQGSISEAGLVPLGELPHALLARDLPKETPLVVFCHHGVRSLRARTLLCEAGFTRVQSLRGGIDAWACQIDAGVGRY